MLGTRLKTGIAMAVALAVVLALDEWTAPWFWLWLIIALVVTGLSSFELVGLLDQTSTRPSREAVIGGVLALVFANWAPHLAPRLQALPQYAGRLTGSPLSPVDALAWPMLAFVGVLMATFVAQSLRFRQPGSTMATIAGTMLAVAYIGLLGSFLLQMRWLPGAYHGTIAVASLFATAKGADTGAYTVGRIMGRHKLWPQLSPNKTVEGAIGGLIFGVAGTLAVTAVARFILRIPSMSWPAAVGFGLVVGTAAQLGDLMESMIKRDCERKDASAAVPGFGGVLDVIDSALFAGPVAYGYWLLFAI